MSEQRDAPAAIPRPAVSPLSLNEDVSLPASPSWPDPFPVAGCGRVVVDDVTRLNATGVARVVYPRCVRDVQEVVISAVQSGHHVCARGTQHSMGAQSICSGGVIVDTKFLNHISYDSSANHVTCGPGAAWSDLIRHLNDHGKSPLTMQSYSTFSVGGTLSVNGHGITTDDCVAASVVSLRIVNAEGEETFCSRETEAELFSLVLGGYGLFGIVVEVTMNVTDNVGLELETLHLTKDDFCGVYEAVQHCDDVEVKLGRIDVTSPEEVTLFLCRRRSSGRCVAHLPAQPKEMGRIVQLLYKWGGPPLTGARFALEKTAGYALDMSDAATTRNEIVYESAARLANLYDETFNIDDTFVLQEYFVPRAHFRLWYTKMAKIFKDIYEDPALSLLNATIRFVNHDTHTFLRYSNHTEGMYAFVLYFRIPRKASGDAALEHYQRRFLSILAGVQGCFYLPYRWHYDRSDLEQFYPNINEFCEKKAQYDPKNVFLNEWYSHYSGNSTSSATTIRTAVPPLRALLCEKKENLTEEQLDRLILDVSVSREHSFQRLMRSATLRAEFKELFLTKIFYIENSVDVYSAVSVALLKAAKGGAASDCDVYINLKEQLGKGGGTAKTVSRVAKQIANLRSQKAEIARQVRSVMGRLENLHESSGRFQDLVSIGDSGKMVIQVRSALKMQGNSYVLHDNNDDSLENALERNSADPVGSYHEVDLSALFAALPLQDGCADVVTMFQGLHHIVPAKLKLFLREVERVLRPGGIFLFREHNNDETLLPMLDVAHSVFNAVTGVSTMEEAEEIRAFRSTMEWRTVIENATSLADTVLYEVEEGDPTKDELLCFVKRANPSVFETTTTQHAEQPAPTTIVPTNAKTVLPGRANLLSEIPAAFLQFAKDVVGKSVGTLLPEAKRFLKENISEVTSCPQLIAETFVDEFFDPIVEMFAKFEPLLNDINIKPATESTTATPDDGTNLFPSELFVIIPVLRRMVKQKRASKGEVLLVSIYNDLFGDDEVEEKALPPPPPPPTEVEDVPVSREAVLSRLTQLTEAMPKLLSPDMLSKIGLNRLQVALINPNGVVGDVNKLADHLSEVLDPTSWMSLDICLQKIQASGKYPDMAMLTGRNSQRDGANPWCAAVMAVLGAPKIQLSNAVQSKASWVGFGEFVQMWSTAQKSRQSATKHKGKEVETILRSFNQQRHKATLRKPADVFDVGEVVSAKYGYTSLTSSYIDVTAIIKERYHRNDTLCLRTVNFEKAFDRDVFFSPFDALRQSFTNTEPRLIVEYYAARPHPNHLIPKIASLRKLLLKQGEVSTTHLNDGEYTWYKLNEWVQVETLQIFASSIRDTPWYRFPFSGFVKTYFTLLTKEAHIVKEKHGVKAALFSPAFATSLVPGVLMAGMFSQLALLAVPLKYTLGDSYDASTLHEEVVLFSPEASKVEWRRFDPRIIARSVTADLVVLKVPTFRHLTGVLVSLAGLPEARLIEISNQAEVQVCVLVDSAAKLDRLRAQHGCTVMFDFRYPTDGEEKVREGGPIQRVSLCVMIPFLLNIVRECGKIGVQVHQIYDWW